MYLVNLLSISALGHALENGFLRKPMDSRTLKVGPRDANKTDWPTNVLFVGGSQTYGLWVPTDGVWYDLGTIVCLGLPAYALGDCDGIAVDQIGVIAGNGPCSFTGISGYTVTVPGNPGDGYTTVGPPQNILAAQCGYPANTTQRNRERHHGY